MKKSLVCLACAAVFLLAGCASNPKNDGPVHGDDEDGSVKIEEKANETAEEISAGENIPKFADWKYKGFGHDLPESAEKVLEVIINPSSKTVAGPHGIVVDIDGSHFVRGVTAWAVGKDADQAKKVLSHTFSEDFAFFEDAGSMNGGYRTERLDLKEEYWFEISPKYAECENPYVAVRLYDIEINTEDNQEFVEYYKRTAQ